MGKLGLIWSYEAADATSSLVKRSARLDNTIITPCTTKRLESSPGVFMDSEKASWENYSTIGTMQVHTGHGGLFVGVKIGTHDSFGIKGALEVSEDQLVLAAAKRVRYDNSLCRLA